ncbi:MAG: hypothetical protein WBG14_04955 [Rhodococcus sp. (in: high G+C Gram-positive bacteria)]
MAADYTEPSPETSIEDRLEATREESDELLSIPTEADPADVVEQHIEVPIDPEDER